MTLFKRLNEEDRKVKFDISDSQKERFLEVFNSWHNEFFIVHGRGSIASIRRLGLIQFRIAMILSLLRYVQAEKLPNEIICKDVDFENAFQIVEVLKSHSAKIYTQFSKVKDTNGLNGKKYQFLQMVPDRAFSRAEALQLADKIDFPRPTLDRFLKTEFFEKIGHGIYQKNKNE